MSFREDYLFWQLIHHLVSEENYRLVKIGENAKEAWLENREKKNNQMIRLLRHDLDYGNWMQNDMELTVARAELFRRKLSKRKLHVLNVYVSTYPPVDDYDFRIASPLIEKKKQKTSLSTMIFEGSNLEAATNKINQLLNQPFSFTQKQRYDEIDVETLKYATVEKAKKRAEDEAKIFEYGKPFYTYIFIAIQILVFIIMELSGGSTNTTTLLQFGAKFNPLIIEGEWWRFFAPIFLHIGFLHLLMNTIALYYLGTAVEKIFGSGRFLFIYLLAGFAGTLASFVFSTSISAGASGAIFGCFGALLYFGVTYRQLFFRTMGTNVLVIIAINLVFGFTVPGIDNAGHLGGLLGGFLATAIVHFPGKRRTGYQLLSLGISIGLIFTFLQIGYGEGSRAVDESSYLVLSQNYIQAEKFPEAIDLLHEYMETEPNPSLDIYLTLGFAELRNGNTDQAIEHFLYIVGEDDSFSDAHYYLTIAYLEEPNVGQAIFHMEKALSYRPKDKSYKELSEHIDDYMRSLGVEGIVPR